MSKIKNVAVIGAGVIGAGWIIRCLAHNKIVSAYDKDLKLKKNLVLEIKRTWPYVKKLFNKKKLNLKNFKYFTSIEEALSKADFIQECATENYAIKTKLMSAIGKYAKPNAIISSSSSGLLPTRIYSKCKNPARTMIGHPFNPVYMCPGVEIVPGKKTKKIFLNKANKFYKFLNFNKALILSVLLLIFSLLLLSNIKLQILNIGNYSLIFGLVVLGIAVQLIMNVLIVSILDFFKRI